jgi:hypothetical protein
MTKRRCTTNVEAIFRKHVWSQACVVASMCGIKSSPQRLSVLRTLGKLPFHVRQPQEHCRV